jgi:restriction system protein
MRVQHSIIVVASTNGYTADARHFAAQVGMTLVDGEELLRIIGTGLHGEALELPAPAARSSTPACPACGAAMVRRTARQGLRAGLDFWGARPFLRVAERHTDRR